MSRARLGTTVRTSTVLKRCLACPVRSPWEARKLAPSAPLDLPVGQFPTIGLFLLRR